MMRKFLFFQGIIEDTFVFENLNMVARHVAHDERPLRARWTIDSDDILYQHHAIDAEAELTRILSEEITAEWEQNLTNEILRTIDEDIVNQLRDVATEEDENRIRRITGLWNGGLRA